jgi:hypothetical protein
MPRSKSSSVKGLLRPQTIPVEHDHVAWPALVVRRRRLQESLGAVRDMIHDVPVLLQAASNVRSGFPVVLDQQTLHAEVRLFRLRRGPPRLPQPASTDRAGAFASVSGVEPLAVADAVLPPACALI